MMMTILSILAFLAIGVLIGFLGTKLFEGSNPILSMVLGAVGSFAASWCAELLGLGTGILTISLWGVVFGILGACLLVAVYGFIAHRRTTA